MSRHLNGKISVAIGALGTITFGAGALTLAARRRGMSTSMLLTRTLLGFAPKVLASEDRLKAKVRNRTYPTDAPLPASLRHRCDVQETIMDGQNVVTLILRSGRSDQHILYLHGGAYFSPLLAAHWSIIGALIKATGASVTVPMYALAPENDYQRGTALVDAVYGAAKAAASRRADCRCRRQLGRQFRSQSCCAPARLRAVDAGPSDPFRALAGPYDAG